MLTTEQQQIIDDVKDGRHVSVTALPGSGKSKVAYELIRQCTDVVVIILMYNRQLCDATSMYLQGMDIDPERTVKAFTFHGLASSLTGEVCHNDRQIAQSLESKEKRPWHMEGFTLLIIDECQDTRPGFMQLVHHMLQTACVNRQHLRIVLLGDPRQLLYGFYSHNRADERFLSLGHLLFCTVNDRRWEQRKLTRSFRSTPSVTNFLNAIVSNHPMVCGNHNGPPVTLDLCNLRSSEPASKIIGIVTDYRPQDVMVLCSSLSAGSPARKLVRTLVRHGIPVHVQRSGALRDNGPVTHASRQGRIQFKTFCASKGLEAKLVIVMNTRSLFEDMENSLYVALSRSTERLVIFQDTSPISLEEITSLRAKLTPTDLSVILNKHSRCREVPRPRTTPTEQPAVRKYNVDTLFQYVDPELLAPIEKMLQRTSMDDTFFEDEDLYTRLFDITSESGQCVNVHGIITGAVRLAIEYFRTHRIPRVIMNLQRSRDPYVERLFQRGMQILDMNLPHVQDAWDIRQLYMKLQAFAMFATAIDAYSSFDEKIADLSDFGFIMHPLIVCRVKRLLQQMQRYVPDLTTSFSVPTSLVVGNAKISSTPTLRSAGCLYSMVHQSSTDMDIMLRMSVHLAVHGVEYGYVSNMYTGSILQVYVPIADHIPLLSKVIDARESCEDDLDDGDFIRRHRLSHK
jgi:hypothetical protein